MTTTIPTFDLSDRLAKARKHANLEQVDIAEMIGVSRTTVSNYESGKTRPAFPVVVMWARVTGTDLTWLVGNDYPKVRLDLTDLGTSPFAWSATQVEQPTLFDEPDGPYQCDAVLNLTIDPITTCALADTVSAQLAPAA